MGEFVVGVSNYPNHGNVSFALLRFEFFEFLAGSVSGTRRNGR